MIVAEELAAYMIPILQFSLGGFLQSSEFSVDHPKVLY